MGRTAEILGLIGWVAVSFVAAAVGAQVTNPAWYESLVRPTWAPPGWLFGPVWTVLYLLMGVGVWLVWRHAGFGGARVALGLFLAQLVLNGAWSWLFFGLERPGLAFAELLVLWCLIFATMLAFARIHRVAALLLVPYLLWVTFAGALNFSIWRLNMAGLDTRITALVVHVPAGGDVTAPLHGRAASYPNWDVSRPEVLETARYFDVANFASRITARSLVSMGFIDDVSTPTSIWSVFNQIQAPKEVVTLVDAHHNHLATAEQQLPYTRRATEWLEALVRGDDPMATTPGR